MLWKDTVFEKAFDKICNSFFIDKLLHTKKNQVWQYNALSKTDEMQIKLKIISHKFGIGSQQETKGSKFILIFFLSRCRLLL